MYSTEYQDSSRIDVQSENYSVHHSSFTNLSFIGSGGAISFISKTSLSVLNSAFRNCSSTGCSGSIHIEQASSCRLDIDCFAFSRSGNFGAAHHSTSVMKLNHSLNSYSFCPSAYETSMEYRHVLSLESFCNYCNHSLCKTNFLFAEEREINYIQMSFDLRYASDVYGTYYQWGHGSLYGVCNCAVNNSVSAEDRGMFYMHSAMNYCMLKDSVFVEDGHGKLLGGSGRVELWKCAFWGCNFKESSVEIDPMTPRRMVFTDWMCITVPELKSFPFSVGRIIAKERCLIIGWLVICK